MFIDANILIAAYLDSQEQGRKCRNLMAKIESGEQHAITNALVINEMLYVIKAKRKIGEMKRAHRIITSYANLSILSIDEKTIAQAIPYIEAGLEVSDAFHAATMKIAGVGTICSYDDGFDKVKGIQRQEP
jgi:predicted nucleic acid-binding protein